MKRTHAIAVSVLATVVFSCTCYADDSYEIKVPITEMVEETCHSYEYPDTTQSDRTYTYVYSDFVCDKLGRITEKKLTLTATDNNDGTSDKEEHVYKYEYYDDGTLKKESHDESYIIEYDTHGLKVATQGSGYDNSYNYEFDDEDRVSRQICTMDDGTIYTTEYTYDENGNLVKEYEDEDPRDGDIYPEVTIYTYNNENQLIKTKVDSDNKATCEETTDYTYDNEGHLLSKKSTSDAALFLVNSNTIHEYTYEYDVIGEATINSEDTDILIPQRKWKYFKENDGIPMPSTCISVISEQSSKSQGGAQNYLYDLKDSSYYLWYQSVICDVCGYTIDTQDSSKCFVKDVFDNNVAAITYEGSALTVSFPLS